MKTFVIYSFIFLSGACLGSLANVLIYRIPLGLSVIRPRSKCPSCGVPVKWYDNIPIISFFLLRARCRNCARPISATYPAIETLLPLFLMYIWFRTGDAKALLIFGFLTFDLIVISFIDLKHRIIPDSLSLSAALIGLLASPFNQYLGGNVLTRIFNSGAGLLAGGAVMYLTGMLGEKIFKKEALGGGDIKLMAAAGAFVGWHGIVAALFFGSFLGTLVSLALIYVFKTKKWGEYVPFGPFLASGVLIYVFAFML